MTNEEFIVRHREDQVQSLALGSVPAGVDLRFCLEQIEGWQIARRKLPSWAEREGIIYPVKVSMEQCSSEQTARYKQQLVERLLPSDRGRMADLTGGFGIDFSFLARLFDGADYVEQNVELCRIARHNLPHLGLPEARVHQMAGEHFADGMGQYSLIYLDPSRRDAAGRKMVALADCTPNIEAMQDLLLSHASCVIVKLSPMLDIQDTLRRLHNVSEVHTVSVGGECKEILVVLGTEKQEVAYHCANITDTTTTFITPARHAEPQIAPLPEAYLYEPNASILKAGVQDALCQSYDVRKLHPFSHLFTSGHFIEDFPGRKFAIISHCSFNKKELKAMLSGLSQANLTVRNFPATVAELRKRLKLREGGDTYLFATTLSDGRHALVKCKPHNSTPC